jgi:hypothetical protein
MTARPAAASFAAAIFLAAGLSSCSSAPAQMTVNGTLEVAVQTLDELQNSYPAAVNGTAQVTITDPSGSVIAVTTASGPNVGQTAPSASQLTMTWGWTAKVPEGLSFYGVSVTGGAGKPVQFTGAQMKAGPGVCLGDAC